MIQRKVGVRGQIFYMNVREEGPTSNFSYKNLVARGVRVREGGGIFKTFYRFSKVIDSIQSLGVFWDYWDFCHF